MAGLGVIKTSHVPYPWHARGLLSLKKLGDDFELSEVYDV